MIPCNVYPSMIVKSIYNTFYDCVMHSEMDFFFLFINRADRILASTKKIVDTQT